MHIKNSNKGDAERGMASPRVADGSGEIKSSAEIQKIAGGWGGREGEVQSWINGILQTENIF